MLNEIAFDYNIGECIFNIYYVIKLLTMPFQLYILRLVNLKNNKIKLQITPFNFDQNSIQSSKF